MLEVVVSGLVTGWAIATPLRITSGLVLLGIAALTAAHALATSGRVRESPPLTPARAWVLFVGITAVNPTTVVYFAAVVLGNRQLVDTSGQGALFVLAAFLASASWQLVLAAGGAALAVHTMLG